MATGKHASTVCVKVLRGQFAGLLVLSYILLYFANSAYAAEAPIFTRTNTDQASAFCEKITEIPKNECEALEAFYFSTNGPDWGNKEGWMVTDRPCSWKGVTCEAKHVSSLSLSGNDISGQLPVEIGNLSELKVLNLSENFNITGPIPASMGNLSQLRELDLFKNKLNGSIPGELGKLTNLTHLYLSTNRLTGPIPVELGSLSNLTVLDLSGNQLYDPIPSTLGNLNKLSLLHLSYNHLTGPIPSSFGQISNLEYLIIVNNHLSGAIPAELGDLNNLITLSLEQNQLSGQIPPELSKLSKVSSINLGWNLLSGSIPPELGNLSNLSSLILVRNHLSGSIPAELGNLSNLYDLSLVGNHLTGSVPARITELTNLQNIGLRYNALKTTDPKVAAFISSMDPGWEETQTLAPENFKGKATGINRVDLTWEPILYIGDFGHYEVSYATHPDGPYSLAGTTTDKSAGGLRVIGLNPGQPYYFRVRTFSTIEWMDWAHIWSEFSPVVSITTPLALQEIKPGEVGEIGFGFPGGGSVKISIPAGAVTETVTFLITANQDINTPDSLALVGISFDMVALQNGIPLNDFAFNKPVLMRVDYTDEQIEGLDESTLNLFVRDKTWVDAAQSCNPLSIYARHLNDNWFSVDICHLRKFAVFGESEEKSYSMYLPVIGRP
jgi:Leucine-rich repeat (LRR) protein